MPAPRILLIDDSPVDLRLMVEFLRGRGFTVLIADGAAPGLSRARSTLPDLILLDVRMPGMDGYTVCRELKRDAETARIPVMFLSGADDVDERLAGFEAGAVDYVVKPFFQEEVVARIQVHLERSRTLALLPTTVELEPRLATMGETREQDWVRSACTLLVRQMVDPPSVTELARSVGTNERRLGELFREQLGTTVFGYLREQRLVFAARLLSETTVPVQDVAERVGYSTSSNFIAAFRERFGQSPRRYRQQQGLAVD